MQTGRPMGVRTSRLGAAAVFAAILGWSINNTLVKLADIPSLAFGFYRLWAGALAMFVVLAVLGRRLTWRQAKASAPGGALLGMEVMLFFTALKLTSVADVVVIGALQPGLTLLVAGPLFGERITRYEAGWTAVSVVGVMLVTIGSSGTPVWSLGGDLLAVGALMAWTVYFLVSKHVRAEVPALEYMTGVTVVAAAVVTPMALASGQVARGIEPADAAWLVLFVLLGQSGHLLLAWAHGQVDVSVSSLLMLAQPIASSVAAWIILGEPFTALGVVGGLVVVASVAAIVGRATRAGPGEEVATPETSPV
jgi:drug/metabolite transporter (DMT)-like permease